jgi:hypothetical protein
MTEHIVLECRNCGRIADVPRLPHHDPAGAIRAVFSHCDLCDVGDFEMVTYFDAAGKAIAPTGSPDPKA